MRAFILSRPRDIAIAEACQARMVALGWNAVVMVDPAEWGGSDECGVSSDQCGDLRSGPPVGRVYAGYGTGNRGMFGNGCAEAIMEGICAGSEPGDVVAKMDCDVWLSDEVAAWMGAAGMKARAMRIDYRKVQTWGGMWAVKRESLMAAREHARTFQRCRCAESYLNLKAFAETGGIEIYPEMVVTQWEPGRERGLAATLPICRRTDRVAEGLALFAGR